MSDAEGSAESLADRIAARGREALVARLRAAYADAARAHSDIVSIDEQRIETMVQSAADRADGLQWRRALAGVAAEELQISVTEALSNPAVARAQELVGAPSYEDSLSELIARPLPPPVQVPVQTANGNWPEPATVEEEEAPPEIAAEVAEVAAPEVATPEPEDVLADLEPEDVLAEPEPEEEPAEDEAEAGDESAEPEPEATAELELPDDSWAEPLDGDEGALALHDGHGLPPHEPEEDQLRVSALHLGGVANLPTEEEGLDLRISSDGLDIVRSDDEIVGRLQWSDIEELELPVTRSRLRRHAHARARLTVHTRHGDASFEIPAFSSDELRERIEPLIDRYGRR